MNIEVDADGFANCPDCGERVNCGTVGISIITPRHKEMSENMGKGKAQKSLPKPTPMPSTVASRSSQVHGIEIPAIGNDDGGRLGLDPEPEWLVALSMEQHEWKYRRWWKTYPSVLKNDRLAQLSVNPSDHDDPSLDDALREEVLNS